MFPEGETSFCNYRYHPLLVVRKNDNLRRFYILTSLSLNPEAVYIFYIQSVIVAWNIQQSFICYMLTVFVSSWVKHCFEFIFEMIRSVSPLLMKVVKDALVFLG